jgi:hypothetical protein
VKLDDSDVDAVCLIVKLDETSTVEEVLTLKLELRPISPMVRTVNEEDNVAVAVR